MRQSEGRRIAPWVLAVDFGTSSTAAAMAFGGAVELARIDGELRMPSMVFWRERSDGTPGTLILGSEAENWAAADPGCLERAPKRRLGDRAFRLGSVQLDVVDTVGRIVGRAAGAAIEQRGGTQPRAVCLTFPVRWGDDQRHQLLGAAERAGLTNISLIEEPIAAAVHFGSAELHEGQYVAVYDLGGGTFDTAVLRRTAGGFEIVGEPGGNPDIGGEEFDDLLYRHVTGRLTEPQRQELAGSREQAWRQANLALQREVRRAKEALSGAPECPIYIPPPVDRQLMVTEGELQGLITDQVTETVDELERTIVDAELSSKDLAGIYLAGGSSRIPLITRMIDKRLGVLPKRLDDPKSVVVLGAARALASSVLTTRRLDGERVTLPLEEERVNVPLEGERVTTPAHGADLTEPLEGERVTAPLEGERVTTPLEGERVTAPLEGERVTAPLEGERVTAPLEGEAKRAGTPRQARTAPQGGAVRDETEAGGDGVTGEGDGAGGDRDGAGAADGDGAAGHGDGGGDSGGRGARRGWSGGRLASLALVAVAVIAAGVVIRQLLGGTNTPTTSTSTTTHSTTTRSTTSSTTSSTPTTSTSTTSTTTSTTTRFTVPQGLADGSQPAPASLMGALTSIPASVYDSVPFGFGGFDLGAERNVGATGNTVLLFAGEESCPYCEAISWPLVIALSRFGTLTGVSTISTGTYESFDHNTPGFSFLDASYSSPYITLTAVELTNNRDQTVETLSSRNQSLYDADTPNGPPFIDFGGRYVISGPSATFNPAALDDQFNSQITAALTDPGSTLGEDILGEANAMTADICVMTNGAPASVCNDSVIADIIKSLPA
ncbi:MAG: Hsp70 family protein [Solirubrobacteraceae bacterium]